MGLFAPVRTAHAHCDLFCGIYDPAQAKIEAASVNEITKKYLASDDPVFKTRALHLREERAELVKHHLMVLWVDFFTPEHAEQFPQMHDLFWRAMKQAGIAKKTVDPADGEKLLELIDEIAVIFWKTDKAKKMGVYPPS